MGTNVTLDWLQIVAGVLAIFGLFFLATGITDDLQDRKIIAPLLGGIGGAAYAVLFDFAFGWPMPILLALIAGLIVGYGLSAWLLLVAMPNYRGTTSLTDASIRNLVLAALLSLIFGLQRLVVTHSLIEAGIAVIAIFGGAVMLLLSYLAVLKAKAAWLRLLGVALTFVSIVLLLIPPAADLFGTPIK